MTAITCRTCGHPDHGQRQCPQFYPEENAPVCGCWGGAAYRSRPCAEARHADCEDDECGCTCHWPAA